MSKCVVHMMKMKMSAMGGIQSHNQREHESKKNKEIDYAKSNNNYDTVLNKNINYQKTVKKRIADLNLKKAIRKDAVVYCSFIVSSDREFFERLGEQEHIKRSMNESESVMIGLREPAPFEYLSEEYREECIREGSREFFEKATEFFQDRYGSENVINGTVHFDEATPHMHIGIVPATKDNRLSAKEIFTPTELKQLQTEFARQVGEKYNLERGKEGSQAKHLDELTFKAKKRQEEVDRLERKVMELRWDKSKEEEEVEKRIGRLNEHAESLFKTLSYTKAEISTLNEEKTKLGQITASLELHKESLEKIIAELMARMSRKESFRDELSEMLKKEKALKFIEQTDQAEKFEEFCKNPRKFGYKAKDVSSRAKNNDLSR